MESRTAIDRYDRALAMAGQESRWGVREARVLAGMGESYYWLADYPAATEALTRAVALAEIQPDPFALALATRYLGDIAINFEGDVDKAERLLSRSLIAADGRGCSQAGSRGRGKDLTKLRRSGGALWPSSTRRIIGLASAHSPHCRSTAANCTIPRARCS